MTFYNSPNFPDDISYGSKGGTEFSTTIIRLRSGHEQRNVNWQYPLHVYDVSYGVKTQAQMASLRNFFMAMYGQAHTFRFKDWHDYATGSDGQTHGATDVVVSVAASTVVSTVAHYQLRKLYSVSSSVMERTITKPVSGTVSVAVSGVEISAGAFSVDLVTGIFTISDASAVADVAAGASVTAGFEFDVPCRFASDVFDPVHDEYDITNVAINIREDRG